MQFDRGYQSPYFVTNAEKMVAELDNPIFFWLRKKNLFNERITSLEPVAQQGKSLLIISEEVEGEALATLVVKQIKRFSLKLLQ